MNPPATSLPAILFAALTLAAAIGGLFAVSRTARRRARQRERRRARALSERLLAFLAGRVSGRRLRATAAAAPADAFWATLEVTAAGLRRAARRALAAELERTRHVAAERRSLRDDSPWRRELAARRVGLLPAAATRRVLRRALAAGPEAVTLAAARALAADGDGATLRWLLAHPASLRRRDAVGWAGLFRAFGRGGAPHLTAALAMPRPPAVERALVMALGRLGHAPAAPAIAGRLAHADAETRVAAARALGALGAVEAVPALLAALDDDAWPVRAQAARALGRLGPEAAITPLAGRLEDRAYWVRRHAAYALVTLGADGRATLARVASTSSDPYAREIAGEALENTERAAPPG